MIQRAARRFLVLPAVGALVLIALMAPVSHAADQPIHAATPASITVDGNPADWDLSADLLGPIHEAGDATKPVLAQSFARYDCDTGTLYLLVQTAPGWYLIPSKEDSFVKSGETVLVDVETGNDGAAPDVAGLPIGSGAPRPAPLPASLPPLPSLPSVAPSAVGLPAFVGFEASAPLAAGTVPLQIHGLVASPVELRTAIFDLTISGTIACESGSPSPSAAPSPTPEPTPSPTPEPTATPTASPTPSPTPEPTASPTPSPTPKPTPSPTPSPTPTPTPTPAPSASPSPSPTPTASPSAPPSATPSPSASPSPSPSPSASPSPSPSPSASASPSAPPALPVRVSIVTVDNRGTADRADDVLIGGATYAVAPDDGDGIFERNEDGPVVAQISDPSGIAVLRDLPPAAYWVIETTAPPGYDLAGAIPYRPSGGTTAQSCFDAGTLTCYADPAGGGMTTVFVVNTPLPSVSTEDDYRSPAVIILAIVGLIIVVGAVGAAVVRRRKTT